jgi:predicted LPLAT superfamily acyltransferase
LKQAWIERPEGGGRVGIVLIANVAQLFGRRIARWVLYPITLYFLIRRGPERRASRAYLSRIFNRRATLWQVAKHIHCFSQVTLDRVYLLRENFRRFDVRCYGLEQLSDVIDKNGGVLLFGAHLGNFDALRVLSLQKPDVTFRAVIDIEQTPWISKVLNALNPSLAATIINARQDGTKTAFEIKEALDARAVVTMLADRARPGNAVQAVEFLGTPALFPTSPWLLAAMLKVPVVLCFSLYRGGNRFELYFEKFADTLEIPRQDRQAALRTVIRRYADRLAYYVRLAPYNWSNFYDFWQSQPTPHSVDTAAASTVDDTSGS